MDFKTRGLPLSHAGMLGTCGEYSLYEPEPGDHSEGETGLITDVVNRHVRNAAGAEAYLCGKTPRP